MDVGPEMYYKEVNHLRLDSLINEKKSENELFNLRFYFQTGITGCFIFNDGSNVEVNHCPFVKFNFRKHTTKSTWQEGVYINSDFPFDCGSGQLVKTKNVTYGVVNLNEYIPLPVRIVITKDGKYTVYISNKESVSYTFPKTFTPVNVNFLQYYDPKGRGRLFYNCTFKE